MASFLLAPLVAATLALSTGVVPDSAKIVARDGALNDEFGAAVAADNGIVIVGAYRCDDSCPSNQSCDSGAAYVMDADTGQELWKLVPSDGANGDWFGGAVDVHGSFIVSGAIGGDDSGTNSGAAYVFDVVTGLQIAKLLPNDGQPQDNFGAAVGVGATVIAVGSPWEDDGGFGAGAVYLFDLDGTQVAKLVAPDSASQALFGSSLATSGDYLIVGSPLDPEAGNSAGAAYLFDVSDPHQPEFVAKLQPEDLQPFDQFGQAVAISGNRVIVGASREDSGGQDAGAAYLFSVPAGQQLAKLAASDAAPGDWFGNAVAIRGDLCMVGAPRENENGFIAGAAYLYDAGTFAEVAKLLPSGGQEQDVFGGALCIDAFSLFGGAPKDDGAFDNTGAVYRFDAAPLLCISDVDGNGTVGSSDLNLLLAVFGCDSTNCMADINQDGVVNTTDLNLLLASFGDHCQ